MYSVPTLHSRLRADLHAEFAPCMKHAHIRVESGLGITAATSLG